MEPLKAKKLPLDYTLDNELLKLLCEANEKYGEYRGFLKNMEYDYKYFLESLFVSESFYSLKIDEIKIDKDDMFYMNYKVKNNSVQQFLNIRKMFAMLISEVNTNNFEMEMFNKINKVLFSGCKKDSKTKGSGKLRKKQTYILKPGIAGSTVSFVPPHYAEVNSLMKNLINYMCNLEMTSPLINVAIAHYQFQVIHPYISGNGKIGRLLIPVQLSHYKKDVPIIFMSEVLELYRNTYFKILSEVENSGVEVFIKFFFQCLIEQCDLTIKKIRKLNKIYKTDLEFFKKEIGGTTIYKVYPIMLKRIVFTINDVCEDTGLHINSVNKVIKKLVEKNIIIKEKKPGTNRVTFKYENMFKVFTDEKK